MDFLKKKIKDMKDMAAKDSTVVMNVFHKNWENFLNSLRLLSFGSHICPFPEEENAIGTLIHLSNI